MRTTRRHPYILYSIYRHFGWENISCKGYITDFGERCLYRVHRKVDGMYMKYTCGCAVVQATHYSSLSAFLIYTVLWFTTTHISTHCFLLVQLSRNCFTSADCNAGSHAAELSSRIVVIVLTTTLLVQHVRLIRLTAIYMIASDCCCQFMQMIHHFPGRAAGKRERNRIDSINDHTSYK